MADILFSALDFQGFRSIWFWVLLTLTWISVSHWTLGVPFDAILRADKRGAPFDGHVDAIAAAHAARYASVMDRAGPWIVGIVTFLLTMLAMVAFGFLIELAQAGFVYLAPIALITGKDVMFGRRVAAQGLAGVQLRQALVWQRFFTQLIGVAILAAAVVFLMAHLLVDQPHLFLP